MPREDVPEELVEVAARVLSAGMDPLATERELAREILSAVSEAGWARLAADESYRLAGAYKRAQNEANEARAQAEEFREAARKLVGVYMADGDLAECVAEMERLTGGQQG